MSSFDVLIMSVRNLVKRKLRTFLTILGVVIGTAAIVVMISLGLAINKTFNDKIDTIGDVTVVTVRAPFERRYGEGVAAATKELVLDDNAIEGFKYIPGVVAATPVITENYNFKSGKFVDAWQNVIGIDPFAMEAMGYKVSAGRLLEEDDGYAAVFGMNVELRFFNANNEYYSEREYKKMKGEEVEQLVDVLNDRIQVSHDYNFGFENRRMFDGGGDSENERAVTPITLNVVGVLDKKGGMDDSSVFMSIDVVKKMIAAKKQYQDDMNSSNEFFSSAYKEPEKKGYDIAYVKCKNLTEVRKVHKIIQEMGYFADIPTAQLDMMQQTSSSLQALLSAIGAVSIFVSAIGIANTMIMAIYERTREIGIMKVVGATISDIQKMFLTEAALIGAIGGVLGVGLSFLISYVLNKSGISFMGTLNQELQEFQSAVSLITPELAVAALVFAALVGLLSGYFPARRAMRLSALSAIRTE